tara:strand:+ start:281 stop:763 length:483 start_codon:yes stop_codon:yes gene_type:complete
MKVLFLHGLESKPGGSKAKHLAKAGYKVLNPALPRESFAESVAIAQEVIDNEMPDLVIGSSRGGAVAMSVSTRGAGLILIAPAWKRFVDEDRMKEFKVRVDSQNTIILHSDHDDLVLPQDSDYLSESFGVKKVCVGESHRMSDPEALEALLDITKWLAKR